MLFCMLNIHPFPFVSRCIPCSGVAASFSYYATPMKYWPGPVARSPGPKLPVSHWSERSDLDDWQAFCWDAKCLPPPPFPSPAPFNQAYRSLKRAPIDFSRVCSGVGCRWKLVKCTSMPFEDCHVIVPIGNGVLQPTPACDVPLINPSLFFSGSLFVMFLASSFLVDLTYQRSMWLRFAVS